MARDTLVLKPVGAEGAQYTADITPTDIIAINGLQADNAGGNVMLIVTNNGTSGAQTATVTSAVCSHGRTQSLSIVVAQGAVKQAGPFPQSLWSQTGGLLFIDSATEDNFEFSAIKLK